MIAVSKSYPGVFHCDTEDRAVEAWKIDEENRMYTCQLESRFYEETKDMVDEYMGKEQVWVDQPKELESMTFLLGSRSKNEVSWRPEQLRQCPPPARPNERCLPVGFRSTGFGNE